LQQHTALHLHGLLAHRNAGLLPFFRMQEQQSQELSPSERRELLQLANAVWPRDSSDPAVQVKSYMAEWLVVTRDLTLPKQTAHSQLGALLGSAKSLGLGSWRSVLSQDPCFVLVKGPFIEGSIQLDAAALRQRVQELGLAGSSGGGDSSSGWDSDSSGDSLSSGGNSSSGDGISSKGLSQVNAQHPDTVRLSSIW
jgi:uncharacterized membrane protein YgcG